MLPYKDIFLDFDDTLYDTRGNATLALEELYDTFHLEEVFDSKRFFTEHYWEINENLWAQYSLGEITRDYLIIERFRRPLALGHGANLSDEFCLELGDSRIQLRQDWCGGGCTRLTRLSQISWLSFAHLQQRFHRSTISKTGYGGNVGLF